MRKANQGLLLGFLAYASWGLLSPVGKHLFDSFFPMGLNAVRFALATLVFFAVTGPRNFVESLRLLRNKDVLWVNVLANGSLTLFLYALTTLPATFATLGFYTAPLWTAILARMMLGEHMGWSFLPAAVGLLLGGYLTLFGAQAPGPVSAIGLALAVGSAVVWGYYTVVLRRAAPGLSLKPLMGASFILGTIWYSIPALLFEGPPAVFHQTPEAWGWIAIHVAFPSLAAFVLFNAALQRAPAGLVNVLVGAELGFTVLFAWLLFGDRLAPDQMAGLGLVLGSVTSYLWLRARQNGPTVPDASETPK